MLKFELRTGAGRPAVGLKMASGRPAIAAPFDTGETFWHSLRPHAPILVRWRFSGLTTVRLRYDLLLCMPSGRSRPDLRPTLEGVYIRAYGGLVSPVPSPELGNPHRRESQRLDRQPASLHHPGAL